MIPGGGRLPPPEELRECERVIWSAITARMPPDWFTADTSPMLKQFCRHIALADGLMLEIEALQQELEALRGSSEPDPERIDAVKQETHVLMRLHANESDRIANIGTKLRLTNQSRYQPKAGGVQETRAASGPKPWENWENQEPQGSTQ
jgi:hypothetical protein